MPLPATMIMGPLRALSSRDSCGLRMICADWQIASQPSADRRSSGRWCRYTSSASAAIGLFRYTGTWWMRFCFFSISMPYSSVCARPTAKAGITSVPPRAVVRLTTSASWS
jgi:hypothetical protein